jgi:hypothetical protein
MYNYTPDPEDYIPMCSEQLADTLGICRAFIRLVIDAGCPLEAGMLTREMLFRWLHENSDCVRRVAGLPDVPPVSDCTISKAGELQEARAILTMLDFMHARACTVQTRKLCEELAEDLMESE